jgi:ribosomal subunit interface protein
MTLRVSGKNVDIGDALRSHIEGRIEDAVNKFFDGGYTGHVTVEREGHGFRCECLVHLDTGVVLQASAGAGDAYKCFDQAADRIEKRLRRYKRRLKNHHGSSVKKGDIPAAEEASYVVFAAPDEDKDVEVDFNPVVVAETSTRLKTLTVAMAVLDLDLIDAPVLMFRNAGNGTINVVYRRGDGNIGWIDPELAGVDG